MKQLNSTTRISGNIANEPIVHKANKDDQARVSLTVATTDEIYKRNGDWEEEVTFHPVVAWGPVAEALADYFEANKLQKGAEIELRGQYKNNNFADQNGTERYQMQLDVAEFQL